jgi:hypothetical protein
MLYLVVAGSIFGFTAYIWLLHHVRPALATSYAYVNPPIAVLFGALLAGERFTSHDLGAMAVILVGVVIITLARARAAKPAEPKPVELMPAESMPVKPMPVKHEVDAIAATGPGAAAEKETHA